MKLRGDGEWEWTRNAKENNDDDDDGDMTYIHERNSSEAHSMTHGNNITNEAKSIWRKRNKFFFVVFFVGGKTLLEAIVKQKQQRKTDRDRIHCICLALSLLSVHERKDNK